jgi:hypothetical protein
MACAVRTNSRRRVSREGKEGSRSLRRAVGIGWGFEERPWKKKWLLKAIEA